MTEIPLRPKNDDGFRLPKADKMIVVSAVLMQLDNQTAFLRYHPEYATQQGRLSDAGKVASRQFWGYGKVKEFREAYEATLREFLGGRKGTPGSSPAATDIDDSRKERALKSLLDQAMGMVEGGADLDADTLKTITEIFKKLNILKDDVEREMRPVRFLPERCSACRARIFVESAVACGQVLDMCRYCKARRKAEESGYRFRGDDLLDIPKEVMAGIEAKNEVKLSDILSEKADN